MGSQIDVDSMVEGGWDISLKAPEDVEEAKHRRKKDLIVFLVGICVLILGIVFAGWVFFDPRFTADQKF